MATRPQHLMRPQVAARGRRAAATSRFAFPARAASATLRLPICPRGRKRNRATRRSPVLSKWPIRLKLLARAGAAGAGGLDPLEHRPGGDLRLPQPGQQPELAGERVAAGGRAQPARQRSADHASASCAGCGSTRFPAPQPRSRARAGTDGPRPVPLPVGRGRSDAGPIPRPTGRRAAGRPADVGPPAGTGNACGKIETQLATHPRGQPRRRLDARHRQDRLARRGAGAAARARHRRCPAICTRSWPASPTRSAASTGC